MNREQEDGKRTHIKLRMRFGVCPVCGAQIERGEMDMYFPYCGYAHWREKEKAEEAKFRRRVYCQNETDRKRSERRYIEAERRAKKEAQP